MNRAEMNERDCVSREQAVEVLKGLYDWSDRDEWACAMNTMEKLPRAVVSDCDDCVSREYIKKELDEWELEEGRNDDWDKWNKAIKTLIDIIDHAPNVAPTERPKGEWIFKTVFPNDKSEFPMGYLVCPVCGSHHRNSTPCNFCDNCGAKMKGADNE